MTDDHRRAEIAMPSSAEGGIRQMPGIARPLQVLITDAMPVNGGDEALLVGLLRTLGRRWPAARFTVLCHRPEESRRLLPGVCIEPALQRDGDIAAVERFYRNADLVLSTP